jgi:hypothetical protein
MFTLLHYVCRPAAGGVTAVQAGPAPHAVAAPYKQHFGHPTSKGMGNVPDGCLSFSGVVHGLEE